MLNYLGKGVDIKYSIFLLVKFIIKLKVSFEKPKQDSALDYLQRRKGYMTKMQNSVEKLLRFKLKLDLLRLAEIQQRRAEANALRRRLDEIESRYRMLTSK